MNEVEMAIKFRIFILETIKKWAGVLKKHPTYQANLLIVTAHAHNSKRPWFRC